MVGFILLSTGCWGDRLPSLDRVGVVGADGGAVSVLFAGCPGDVVDRVVLNLTDDDFEQVEEVLWEVRADEGAPPTTAFTVGRVPPGFRQITALDAPLQEDASVQVVVTSTEVGTIPMSFTIDDLRLDEVLVRQDDYTTRSEFGDRAAESCDR